MSIYFNVLLYKANASNIEIRLIWERRLFDICNSYKFDYYLEFIINNLENDKAQSSSIILLFKNKDCNFEWSYNDSTIN